MNKKIDELFHRLEGQWDIQNPPAGHKERFLSKLNAEKNVEVRRGTQKGYTRMWKPMAIAASFLLIVSLSLYQIRVVSKPDLAEVAPEMMQSQMYFNGIIEQELVKLNAEVTPDTQKVVDDAMIQINRLENEYEKLKGQLLEQGADRRIIQAMVTNLQNRINLLNQVMDQIERVKKLKQQNHESNVI